MAAQGMKSQWALAVPYAGAIVLILFVPFVGAFVITLGTIYIPPIWFAPPHFDAYLNWTVHVSIAPLVWLPLQDPACAVPTHLDEVFCGQQLMPPLHHLAQMLHSVQERLISQVKFAVQIVLFLEVVNRGPPCM